MAASPQVVDATPLFLTGIQGTYDARHFRKDIVGQGVFDSDSFRIRQRAAGANMSIDGMTASILNRAYVRDSLATDLDGGSYRVSWNTATPVNVDIAAADPTNPRIDQVYLTIEDSQETGSVNSAKLRVVTGTATGGATLDNRTGVGAAPASMSSILLADILVDAAAATIVNAKIRDRRPFATYGKAPSPLTVLDQVAFLPAPGTIFSPGATIQSTAGFDAQQGAALMYLPQRIVSATRIKFKTVQGGTANANNSAIGIYDASMRQIVLSTPAAYGGSANQQVSQSLTITANTFEVGYYWIWHGSVAGTGSATVTAPGLNASVASFITGPNQYVYATSGGTTAPTTLLAMTDLWGISAAAVTARTGVPVPTLSVG